MVNRFRQRPLSISDSWKMVKEIPAQFTNGIRFLSKSSNLEVINKKSLTDKKVFMFANMDTREQFLNDLCSIMS